VRGQTQRRRLAQQFAWAVLPVVPLPRDRSQLPFGEVVCELPQLALLRRQVERDPGGCYPRHRGSTPKLVVARGRRTARPRTGTARPGAA
jgi:hypothetical protein